MTIQEKQTRYVQQLSQLEDEFDQYTFLMQLASQHPELTLAEHEEENRFLGCQSNLWISLGKIHDQIYLSVDSDTLIVKGLAVMLADIITGSSAFDVSNARLDIFEQLQLDVALTSVRRHGFTELIRYIQSAVVML